MSVDCQPEFLKRQALLSALIASYLKKSPHERIETLRQNFPAIESLNDRIRAKLAAGVGEGEAEKIVKVLRLEGMLLREALQAVQSQPQQGLPWLRKISNELYQNSSSIQPNYPELAEALLKYDDALFKQIEHHIAGMEWEPATSESNGAAIKVASAANKIAARRAAFQTPLTGSLFGANSQAALAAASPTNWRNTYSAPSTPANSGSVVLSTNNGLANNGSVWVQPQTVVTPPPAPSKGMDWKKTLLWLLALILLGSLLYSLWKKKKERETVVVSNAPYAGYTGYPANYRGEKVVVGQVGPISPEAARIIAEDDAELQSGYSARSPAFDFSI